MEQQNTRPQGIPWRMSPALKWEQHWLSKIQSSLTAPKAGTPEQSGVPLLPSRKLTLTVWLQEELAASIVSPPKDECEVLKGEEPQDEEDTVDHDQERVRNETSHPSAMTVGPWQAWA